MVIDVAERTSMREYSKIETLYERGKDFSVTDVLRSPVIGTISKWLVTEKVDGTNIRIDLRRQTDLSRFDSCASNRAKNYDF